MASHTAVKVSALSTLKDKYLLRTNSVKFSVPSSLIALLRYENVLSKSVRPAVALRPAAIIETDEFPTVYGYII